MSCRWAASLFLGVAAAASIGNAVAEPARIIILRHGEKADAYRLCDIGVQRSRALAARYLGRGSDASLFATGGGPDAFFAITLHTLELISPAATTWRKPVITYSVLPQRGQSAADATRVLNERTQEAVADVMANWNGKTVVMVWEHHHIADEKLEQSFPDQKVYAAAVAEPRRDQHRPRRPGPEATTIISGSSTTEQDRIGRRASR